MVLQKAPTPLADRVLWTVMVTQLVDSSMKGDVRTAAMVLRLIEEVSATMGATNETAEIPLSDKDALKRISARLLLLAEGED